MRLHVLPAFALVALLGCGNTHQDEGKVLANVGGEKITEGDFRQALTSSGAPSGKIESFMSDPLARDERAQYLANLATSKAMIAFARQQGLDKDPQVRQAVELATAKAYFQILLDRRVGQAEPTEAQLRAFYDKKVAERAALGQANGLPKFEDVKAQLPQLWRQEQLQSAQAALLADVKEKVPTTIDENWRVVGR